MYFSTAFALEEKRKIHSLSGLLISNQPATCLADPFTEYKNDVIYSTDATNLPLL